MTRLHLDFETFSRHSLPKVGTSRYARDPSTEMLMLGWAIDDDPVDLVRFAEGEKAPRDLKDALRDPEVEKWAWNAPFERNILQHVAGLWVPYEQWRDTMVLALSLSFPGSLEKCGEVVGLGDDKKKIARGKALIRKFCAYRKPTKKEPWSRCTHETNPEEWEEFVEYCRRDVEAERAIYKKLRKWNLPEDEWALWFLDQEINDAGIPISMPVARNAIKVYKDVLAKRFAEMKEITGLANPNSNQQLLPWLRDHGYPFEDLKKNHVKEAWESLDEDDDFDEELARVLELRLETSKTSPKKYAALLEATDDDGNLRYCLQFNGAARTGRWGGRKYQPQNLAKPPKYLEDSQVEMVRDLECLDSEAIELLYDKPMDLLSSCVRPVVQAPRMCLLVDADLTAIENIVLGWLADDQKILDVFRNGRDPYIDFAKYMFKTPYEELWHEYKEEGNKEKRTLAKPGVLGCGYLLGPGEEKLNKRTGEVEASGLLGYAKNLGVDMTPDQSARAVKTFRNTFDGVVQFWDDLDKAARRCIRTGKAQRVGLLRFDKSGPFMRIQLPKGRHLHYYKPSIKLKRTPWGAIKPTICYWGTNDRKQWVEGTTHPGKLAENCTQAVARDILAHGMSLARDAGMDIRFHVHDQVIALVRAGRAQRALELLVRCMSTVPEWAPGLILNAEGVVSRVFIKD